MKKILTLAMLLTAAVSATATDTLTVRIKSMRCGECAHKVKTALRQDPGVGQIEFNLERRTATIAYDAARTCPDSICARIDATKRYKASAYSPTEVIRRGIGQRMDDMHCGNCANRIMQKLSTMAGIDSLAPHLDKHYFFIRYDANRTCKDSIRTALNAIGFTPVNYYTSDKIGYAYYLVPLEKCNQETMEAVLAIDGVEDVNVNPRKKSLAVTYFSEDVSAEKLLSEIHDMGIPAELPPAHVCKE